MRNHFFFLIVTITLSFMGCEVDPPIPNKSKSLSEFFENNKTPTQTFYTEADASSSIVGEMGTYFTLSPHSFSYSNGYIVTGRIDIELREFYKKSQLISSHLSTVTIDNKILKSAGAIYLKATQNGQALNLVETISIAFPMSQNQFDTGMKLYYGIQTDGNPVQWVNGQNQFGSNVSAGGGSPYAFVGIYTMFINPADSIGTNQFAGLGWLNCDDVISDTLTTTSLTISVSGEHDWVNTATFIVFDDINSVMRVDSHQDSIFFSPSNIPVTFNVTIVVITIEETKAYLATKAIKVEPNLVQEVTPVETSEEEILSQLEQLNQ